jgi:hypothetical protein
VGELGPEDKVTERKLFSFVRVPEEFRVGDIVKVKHPAEYKRSSDFHRYGTNLYKIVSISENTVTLAGVSQDVPISELLPVAVDGVEDRWIYFDPVIAASIVFPGEELPVHRTDYSYYMEKFERCFEGKKSYKELVEKNHLMYVHEVQHWLRKHHREDRLRINEVRLR